MHSEQAPITEVSLGVPAGAAEGIGRSMIQGANEGTPAFNPVAERVGTVEDTTLGGTGWVGDGQRYVRGDGK